MVRRVAKVEDNLIIWVCGLILLGCLKIFGKAWGGWRFRVANIAGRKLDPFGGGVLICTNHSVADSLIFNPQVEALFEELPDTGFRTFKLKYDVFFFLQAECTI